MNKEIQYLRGIASLLVVFAHYKFSIIEQFCGAIGVDLFFLISGFIISLSIGRYLDNPNKFIINRLFRIYPLWLVLSLITFALFMLFSPFDRETYINQLILSPLFLGKYSPLYSEPIIFSGWSLRYEVFFYILVFIGIKLFSKNKNLKQILVITLGLLGLIGLFLDFSNAHIDFFFSSFFLLFSFGMLIEMNFKKLTLFFSNKLLVKILLVVSAFLMLFVMLFFDKGYEFIGNAKEFINLGNNIFVRRFYIWGIPSILFFLFFILNNFKENKILYFLGSISYSLYLIHSLFKPFVASNKFLELVKLDREIVYIIIIIVSIGLSYFSRIWIEVKFSNYLRKQFLKITSQK